MDSEEDAENARSRVVTPFPQMRVRPPGSKRPPKNLGLSPLSQQLGAPAGQATGHWCSRCEGIWFGYVLEVACPQCGNRHG